MQEKDNFDIGEDPISPDYEEIDMPGSDTIDDFLLLREEDAPDTIPNSMGEMSYEYEE